MLKDGEERELPDVLQFMQMLWAIVHALEQKSKRMARDLGVTGPQRLVLRVVGLFPGLSAGGIARVLHIHPSTLTGMLKRLVDGGLVMRLEHKDDRRRAVLRLTKRGVQLNRSTQGTVEAAVTVALRVVSPADRARVQRTLAILAAHLDPESGSTRRAPRRR